MTEHDDHLQELVLVMLVTLVMENSLTDSVDCQAVFLLKLLVKPEKQEKGGVGLRTVISLASIFPFCQVT